jgi:ribosome modulation factor
VGGDANGLSLASIQGYIAAQDRKGRDSCPHVDGALRAAWLEGYEGGIKAMTDWGENVSCSVENRNARVPDGS